MKLIDIIAGARPNFMKIAPIIHELEKRKRNSSELNFRLVHTGQHYDKQLSDVFFEQLKIPKPHVNLNVGSGSQAEQTAGIMLGYEKLLSQKKSDLCLVVGDVTSTMACAITAKKMGVSIAHVEAGIRSGDLTMPEEINRLVTDSITDWFFTTSEFANENLRKEGAEKSALFFVGNTMIDTLLSNEENFTQPAFWNELNLERNNFLVLTLHRPVNVDGENTLLDFLINLGKLSQNIPVVFPVHPRTKLTLSRIKNFPDNIKLVEPQPYFEFNYLVGNSKAVITDSGGVTEEATILGIPCLTVRETTERPETVTLGTNELIGTDLNNLSQALKTLFAGKWKIGGKPPLWDGKSARRIVTHLEKLL